MGLLTLEAVDGLALHLAHVGQPALDAADLGAIPAKNHPNNQNERYALCYRISINAISLTIAHRGIAGDRFGGGCGARVHVDVLSGVGDEAALGSDPCPGDDQRHPRAGVVLHHFIELQSSNH